MTDTIIELKEAYKIYNPGDNAVHALDGVSFSVYKGDFVAVIGQSGSGKSTMINILGCLDLPDKGNYYLNGVNVAKLSDKELSRIRSFEIGFIFQEFYLIPTLTAFENVELPLIYKGFSKHDRKKRAKAALKIVGLAERMSHKPGEMSGGQQQRTAIARAIAGNPAVILADEPTGNLDSKMGKEIMDLLLNLNKNGSTVILITHDGGIAGMAKRTVTMCDGKMI